MFLQVLNLRFVLSLILIVALNTLHGQDQQYNQTDDLGQRQGPWRGYFSGGTIRYEGQFSDGKPVGLFRYFYPEGELRTELIHEKGEKPVKATLYHRNGNILGEGFFVDQSKEGLWRYFSENGILIAENYYQDNKNHGVWKTFYPQGEIGEIVTWHRGEKNGAWEKYLPDGTLLLKANFQNDKLNGKYQLFHRNKQVMVSGQYKDDNRDETWVYFTEAGELEKRVTYDKGTLVKEEIFIERIEPDIPISPGNPAIPVNPFGINRM